MEMNDALDQVVSALGRQIRKNKTKLAKRLHSGSLDQYVEEYFNSEDPDEGKEYEVVRNKKFFVQRLSIDEAILQMNMLGHQFFLFRNEEDGEINVVYKRKDGKYGLLEPDQE